MFTQDMTIAYNDGAIETVTVSQADVKSFELWALQRGIRTAPGSSLINDAPILFLRVAAWSAECRRSGHRVDFDTWDGTVAEVTPVTDPEEADPTAETTPDTALPS